LGDAMNTADLHEEARRQMALVEKYQKRADFWAKSTAVFAAISIVSLAVSLVLRLAGVK